MVRQMRVTVRCPYVRMDPMMSMMMMSLMMSCLFHHHRRCRHRHRRRHRRRHHHHQICMTDNAGGVEGRVAVVLAPANAAGHAPRDAQTNSDMVE